MYSCQDTLLAPLNISSMSISNHEHPMTLRLKTALCRCRRYYSQESTKSQMSQKAPSTLQLSAEGEAPKLLVLKPCRAKRGEAKDINKVQDVYRCCLPNWAFWSIAETENWLHCSTGWTRPSWQLAGWDLTILVMEWSLYSPMHTVFVPLSFLSKSFLFNLEYIRIRFLLLLIFWLLLCVVLVGQWV